MAMAANLAGIGRRGLLEKIEVAIVAARVVRVEMIVVPAVVVKVEEDPKAVTKAGLAAVDDLLMALPRLSWRN